MQRKILLRVTHHRSSKLKCILKYAEFNASKAVALNKGGNAHKTQVIKLRPDEW